MKAKTFIIITIMFLSIIFSSSSVIGFACEGDPCPGGKCCYDGPFNNPTLEWCCLSTEECSLTTPGDCVDCIDYCSPEGAKTCFGDTTRAVCGDYDADSCLEWDLIQCGIGSVCENGNCELLCPFNSFSNIWCGEGCPTGYDCVVSTRCLGWDCSDPGDCSCVDCKNLLNGYFCGNKGSSTSYTCTDAMTVDEGCDGVSTLNFYPLKKCSDQANPDQFCQNAYGENRYCDSGHCCQVGDYWDAGSGICVSGGEQCTEIDYVPGSYYHAFSVWRWYLYGVDPSGYYSGTNNLACCSGVYRYGDTGNYFEIINIY